jgi:hypothetical protein
MAFSVTHLWGWREDELSEEDMVEEMMNGRCLGGDGVVLTLAPEGVGLAFQFISRASPTADLGIRIRKPRLSNDKNLR